MKKKIRSVLIEYLNNEEGIKKEMAMGLIKKAISGDVRAFETIAKFIGEYPTKVQTIETDEEIKKLFPFGF